MKERGTTAQSTMPPFLFFLLFIVGVLCSYLSQVAYWENFVVAVLRRGENRVPVFFCFLPHSRTISSVMAQTTSNLQNFGSIQECQWKEHCREGTTPHNDAVLNEIIYFAVFRGLKINLCSWEVEQKNRQRYELLETVLSPQGKKRWVMTLRRKVQRMLPCSAPSHTIWSEGGEDFACWSLGSMKKVRVKTCSPTMQHHCSQHWWSPMWWLLQYLSEGVVRTLHKTNIRRTAACALGLDLA